MNCSRCGTSNDNTAKYCRNCGTELTIFPEQVKADSRSTSHLILIFLCITFAGSMTQFAIQRLVNNWYESPVRIVQGILWLVQNVSFILLPLAIRDKNLRIIGLVITIIMIIYWSYSNIQFLIR